MIGFTKVGYFLYKRFFFYFKKHGKLYANAVHFASEGCCKGRNITVTATVVCFAIK